MKLEPEIIIATISVALLVVLVGVLNTLEEDEPETIPQLGLNTGTGNTTHWVISITSYYYEFNDTIVKLLKDGILVPGYDDMIRITSGTPPGNITNYNGQGDWRLSPGGSISIKKPDNAEGKYVFRIFVGNDIVGQKELTTYNLVLVVSPVGHAIQMNDTFDVTYTIRNEGSLTTSVPIPPKGIEYNIKSPEGGWYRGGYPDETNDAVDLPGGNEVSEVLTFNTNDWYETQFEKRTYSHGDWYEYTYPLHPGNYTIKLSLKLDFQTLREETIVTIQD